jgi:hypothetical protein
MRVKNTVLPIDVTPPKPKLDLISKAEAFAKIKARQHAIDCSDGSGGDEWQFWRAYPNCCDV